MLTEVANDDLDVAREAGATVLDVRKSEPVFVTCQSGGRSTQAAQLLDRAGIDVRNVAGGTSAWIRSGRPVETGAPGH
ncbi:MAG: rhodanese-like domain-containing protein [Mycobacteriales bacterium]